MRESKESGLRMNACLRKSMCSSFAGQNEVSLDECVGKHIKAMPQKLNRFCQIYMYIYVYIEISTEASPTHPSELLVSSAQPGKIGSKQGSLKARKPRFKQSQQLSSQTSCYPLPLCKFSETHILKLFHRNLETKLTVRPAQLQQLVRWLQQLGVGASPDQRTTGLVTRIQRHSPTKCPRTATFLTLF